MVGQLSNMAVLPEKDCGTAGADLLLSMCIKVLAQTVAAVPALCFTVLPRLSLADADRQVRFEHAATGSCATGCPPPEPCAASESSMTNSMASEEHVPTTCKAQDETLAGPDTSVRLKRKEINSWLLVLKNKDDDDNEDDEDEEDEEDDEDDVADEEDVGDEGDGEEAEGLGGEDGGDDDEDDEDDDDENGKGDDEEEDEDAVEAEDEEDEDGVEDEEEEEDEDDEEDEAPEPPQKKRK